MLKAQGYQKIKIATINLAADILTRVEGAQIDTVVNYAQKFNLSLGTIQKALVILSEENAILLEKKGKQGSVIKQIDYLKLLTTLNYKFLLCVMPLTYSSQYKKLMDRIEANFNLEMPIYFAHMRGGRTRLDLIEKDIFHFALVSKLAVLNEIKQGRSLKILADFGKQSYLTKHVILKKQGPTIKIGIDKESDDYILLTQHHFQKRADQVFIEIRYSEVVEKLIDGTIDASIWNYDDVLDKLARLDANQIDIIELENNEINELATQAVLVSKNENLIIQSIFNMFFYDKENTNRENSKC